MVDYSRFYSSLYILRRVSLKVSVLCYGQLRHISHFILLFFFSNVNSVNDAIITPEFFSFLHYYMKYISCDNIMHAWLVPVCMFNESKKKKVSIIFLLKRKKNIWVLLLKTVLFDFVYLSSIRRADDVERPRFLMGLDLTRVKIHGIIIWIRRCYITTIEHPASAASPVDLFKYFLFAR